MFPHVHRTTPLSASDCKRTYGNLAAAPSGVKYRHHVQEICCEKTLPWINNNSLAEFIPQVCKTGRQAYCRGVLLYQGSVIPRIAESLADREARRSLGSVRRVQQFLFSGVQLLAAMIYRDSSRTSMPEMVALFAIGSKVRFSLPCALGLR